MVSSHPDPIPALLSVKHLQEQLILLNGKASNIANSYFAAAVRAQQSPSTNPLCFGLYNTPKSCFTAVMSEEGGTAAGDQPRDQPSAEQGQGASLTFVLSGEPHGFGSRALLGLLLAAQPVQPPPPELPELRVAGREPVRAVPLRGRGQPGAGPGALQAPGLCAPSPARLLLLRGAPSGALLDDQAGPLQQQEAAGHQVSCGEEEEHKLDPTEKLL